MTIDGELNQLINVLTEAKRNAFWVVEDAHEIVDSFGIEGRDVNDTELRGARKEAPTVEGAKAALDDFSANSKWRLTWLMRTGPQVDNLHLSGGFFPRTFLDGGRNHDIGPSFRRQGLCRPMDKWPKARSVFSGTQSNLFGFCFVFFLLFAFFSQLVITEDLGNHPLGLADRLILQFASVRSVCTAGSQRSEPSVEFRVPILTLGVTAF
jgi:hypothetical protein